MPTATWVDVLLRRDAPAVPDQLGGGRFDGLYGGLYDRVIRSDALLRGAPLPYGRGTPVARLDELAARVAADVPPGGTLLDVPCGGGALFGRLAHAGLRGRVLGLDLSAAMLARAQTSARRDAPALEIAVRRADALDLPLRDGSVDAVISLNGLHCIPDPPRFLAELARVLRAGRRAWIVTLVSGADLSSAPALIGGRVTGILPALPPTRAQLARQLRAAGFGKLEWLGGRSLVGVAARRSPN